MQVPPTSLEGQNALLVLKSTKWPREQSKKGTILF